jgi:hypothetical protein
MSHYLSGIIAGRSRERHARADEDLDGVRRPRDHRAEVHGPPALVNCLCLAASVPEACANRHGQRSVEIPCV